MSPAHVSQEADWLPSCARIILLATEFVLVTLWGYRPISPSGQWSLTLRLTACCTSSEGLILQVTRVTCHTVSPEWFNPQDRRDSHISLEMPTTLN